MATLLRRPLFVIILLLALGAAYGLHRPGHRTQAGGGYAAHVLVLREGVESATVVELPGWPIVVMELKPGDRILRTSGAIWMLEEGVYIPVYTATGEPGWLLNGEDITETASAVYASDSQLETGVTLIMTQEGVSCRAEPTFRAEVAGTLAEQQAVLITGGPYPAELGLWWQVTTSADHSCWLYDMPGQFDVAAP